MSTTPRRLARLVLAATAAVAALSSGFVLAPAQQASAAAPSAASLAALLPDAPGQYLVQLKAAPAASYDGGVAGLKATRPAKGTQLEATSSAVGRYTDYLHGRTTSIAAAVGAKPLYDYGYAFSGFSAKLTSTQVHELRERSDVKSVLPSGLLKTQAESDYDFLGMTDVGAGAPDAGLWSQVGGDAHAGEGIVVGDIDTGIAPENPSFAGDPLPATPSTSGPYIGTDGLTHYDKSDGGTFTGTCGRDLPAGQWLTSDCNTKLISARYYISGYGAGNIGPVSVGEYPSPRDGAGHGSHTASTSVGEPVGDAVIAGTHYGKIEGMAPAAKLAVYKACWSGPDPTTEDDDGCNDADLVAAIDQAVADGVDVINFSIGGGAATDYYTDIDQAFLGAAAAGIFVAVAAGNEGPGASTSDHAAPWYTTVAASTIPSYEATATLGDGEQLTGASITVPAAGVSGPLVLSQDVAAPGANRGDAELCQTGSLDPAKVTGKIVVCTRGVNARVDKSAEVAREHGIGMILINPTPNSLDLDQHSVPSIAIDAQHYDALIAYAGTPGATASFAPGNAVGDSPVTPQIAGFSSRGPDLAGTGDVLKPDISAPGVNIIADGPNAEGSSPSWEFMSGTSMATPHIAGLAAVYLGAHPHATPAEVKSAMMTTAYPTKNADGSDSDDVFAQGAGEVDPPQLLHPGLLYLSGVPDWNGFLKGQGEISDPAVTAIDAPQLNQASIADVNIVAPTPITRTVTAETPGTYRVQAPSIPGFDVSVEPSVLTLAAAGATASYTVTFTRTTAPLDSYVPGSLDWVRDGSGLRVHSPVVLRAVSVLVGPPVHATGTSGSTVVPFTNGAGGRLPVGVVGAVKAKHVPADGTADDPAHTTYADGYGDIYQLSRELPTGVKALSFSVHGYDPGAEVGLTLLRVEQHKDSNGQTVYDSIDQGWVSPTDTTGDASVVASNPPAGYYVLLLENYGSAGDVDMSEAQLRDSSPSRNVTLDTDDTLDAPGAATGARLSWDELDPGGEYLAGVTVGATTTGVLIDAGPAMAFTQLAPPAVVGSPGLGATVSATTGTWAQSNIAFGYQWQVDGVDVPGATAPAFTIPDADAGRSLTVAVTAQKHGFVTQSFVSAPVSIALKTLSALTPPAVSGDPQLGHRLTATPGSWSVPGVSLAYQWRIDGADVPDATTSGFTLPQSALGKHVSVVVTASAPAYAPASAESAAVAVPDPAHPAAIVKKAAKVKLSLKQHTVVVKGKKTARVTVTIAVSSAVKVGGKVTVTAGHEKHSVTLKSGKAKLELTKQKKGVVTVTAKYAGSATVKAAQAAAKIRLK